ncbi:hypothetical protein [Methylocystis heyeri]|uniref:Uncharacterized protein n=1 Tax=Methylocystis heyeri TaxID=391905 RepID=A0A6B8KDT9_9HYPH|nr:hypothetical protein [Methylocystis heyeri]QGM45181.1 hypothetical protein H2LOC_005450 [Methylocystis heyeri]
MFFHIDADEGHRIIGWVAPDDPAQTPKILVKVQDQEEFALEADILRPEVRDLGLHPTGEVGFEITNLIVPDLENIDDVELFDAVERIPIYRRFPPGRFIERKLFLFDCSVMPQRRIINAASRRFALCYTAAEHYLPETIHVLINNKSARSQFLAGRPNFSRVCQHLRSAEYLVAAMLRDPFTEMAERLLVLKLLSRPNSSHLLKTFVTGVEPLVDFARDLKIDEHRAVLSAFRNCTDAQRMALASPMVKTFGCNPEEAPDWPHVSRALENLATMDVVGMETSYPLFRSLLNEAVGTEFLRDEASETFSSVSSLAQILARVGLAADLLEHDIALYEAAQESILAAVEGGSEGPAPNGAQII